MSHFTYSNDPNDSDRDYVRFRLGDTDSTDVILFDEEIDGAIAIAGTKEGGAYLAAKAIIAKWTRVPDSKMGKLDIKFSQRVTGLQGMLEELEAEAKQGGGLGVPWMAAHSISRRNAIVDNDDRLEPAFSLGMDEIHRQSADNEVVDEAVQ